MNSSQELPTDPLVPPAAVAPHALSQPASTKTKSKSRSLEPSNDGSNSVASWLDTVNTAVPPATAGGEAGEEDVSFAALFDHALNRAEAEDRDGTAPIEEKKKRTKDAEKRKTAGDGAKPAKRPRPESLKAVQAREDAAELRAFRHSQRSLRKEAQSGLSLKDIMSRSMPFSPTTTTERSNGCGADETTHHNNTLVSNAAGFMNGGESNPFSPTASATNSLLSPASTTSASTASAWSPALVSDITSSFLATMQQQRVQRVQRVMQRDPGAIGLASHNSKPVAVSAAAAVATRRRVTPPPPQPQPLGWAAAKTTTTTTVARPTASLTTAVMEDLLSGNGGVDPFSPPTDSTDDDNDDEEYDYNEDEEEEEEMELVIGDEEQVMAEADRTYHYTAHVSEKSLRQTQMCSSSLEVYSAVEHSLSFATGDHGNSQSQEHLASGTAATAATSTGATAGSSGPHDELSAHQLQELGKRHRAEEAREKDVTRAATRRHEMWRLEQRHRRAQRLLSTPNGPTTTTTTSSAASNGPTTNSNAVSSTEKSISAFESSMRRMVTTAGGGGSPFSPTFPMSSAAPAPEASLHSSLPPSSSSATATIRSFDVNAPSSPTGIYARKNASVRDVNLSKSDVSMIMRINSFDRTSSQKVVTFETAKAAKENSNSQGTFQ